MKFIFRYILEEVRSKAGFIISLIVVIILFTIYLQSEGPKVISTSVAYGKLVSGNNGSGKGASYCFVELDSKSKLLVSVRCGATYRLGDSVKILKSVNSDGKISYSICNSPDVSVECDS